MIALRSKDINYCVSPADEVQLCAAATTISKSSRFTSSGERSDPAGEKHEACGETFSENSPFFTRGGEEVRFCIGATSPFSDLGEWEERGVTALNA